MTIKRIVILIICLIVLLALVYGIANAKPNKPGKPCPPRNPHCKPTPTVPTRTPTPRISSPCLYLTPAAPNCTKRQAEGTHNDQDIIMLYKTQNGLCWWCGDELNGFYHIDHRVPLSRGGSNWPNNLCLTCASCNTSKSDKLPSEWIGRLL